MKLLPFAEIRRRAWIECFAIIQRLSTDGTAKMRSVGAQLTNVPFRAGCSLDWLLTGRSVAFEKIENLPMVAEKNPQYGARNLRLSDTMVKIRDIYAKKTDKDIEALEYFVDTVLNHKGGK